MIKTIWNKNVNSPYFQSNSIWEKQQNTWIMRNGNCFEKKVKKQHVFLQKKKTHLLKYYVSEKQSWIKHRFFVLYNVIILFYKSIIKNVQKEKIASKILVPRLQWTTSKVLCLEKILQSGKYAIFALHSF